MGIFSFLFAPPPPKGKTAKLSLRRIYRQTYLPPADYTVIDLETTGLDACTCEILEIAAVRYRDNKTVEKFHTYVRPEGAIPKEASQVNHITWAQVHSSPSLEQTAESFITFIGSDTLVGYNVEFDIKFIQTRLQKDISNPAFDVLSFARIAFPNLPRYRLDDMRNRFHLSGDAHTALGDCITTASVMQMGLETDEGIKYWRSAIARAEFEKEAEAKRQSYLEERKSLTPPTSELHKLSALMKGSDVQYFSKVKYILTAEGLACSDVETDFINKSLRYKNGMEFFAVKLDGKLRYITLYVPMKMVQCDYICTPETLSKGEGYCRIYISSPNDLDNISEYIIAAFEHAHEYYDLISAQLDMN